MGKENRIVQLDQESAYKSPWNFRTKVGVMLWQIVWVFLFRPSPRFFNKWRLWLLKRFGARISGRPYVAQSCKIKMPWNLTLKHRACVGPGSEVYNLGPVIIKERATVAQYVYLCNGSHNISTPRLPLIFGKIIIEKDVFVGASALILPAVRLEEGAVIGAGSVVTKDMPAWHICAGNPCRVIKERPWDPEG